MLLNVIDGNGTLQTRIVPGQETVTDLSGTITESDVAQELAAANTDRSGYVIQNLSEANDMWVNDLGDDATPAPPSIKIGPGGILSAPGSFPVVTGALSIVGTAGDSFTAREW